MPATQFHTWVSPCTLGFDHSPPFCGQTGRKLAAWLPKIILINFQTPCYQALGVLDTRARPQDSGETPAYANIQRPGHEQVFALIFSCIFKCSYTYLIYAHVPLPPRPAPAPSGRGASSRVYKAVHLKGGWFMAVKEFEAKHLGPTFAPPQSPPP